MNRTITAVTAVGLLVSGLVTVATSAAADTSPVDGAPVTLAAAPLPTWQTNGVVWGMEIIGSTIYVGGSFTAVRPPGVAAGGEGEVPRRNLAAFDVASGELLPWAPEVRAPESMNNVDITCQPGEAQGTRTCDTVYELRGSPDGSRLYVGGDFNKIDNATRYKIAAFDTRTGRLATEFQPQLWGRVRALVVTDTTVYAGGNFTDTKDGVRTRLAAYNRADGAILPWAPTADDDVMAMVMAPDQSRLVVGGEFDNLNGNGIHGLGAVDAATGRNTRWDSSPIPKQSATRVSWVTDLVVDEDTVYASANGEGTFDGRVALNPYTGEVRWLDTCQGATWSLAVVRGVLYSGSHAHNCPSTPGGFSESRTGFSPANQRYYRFLAQTTRGAATELLHWYPTTNGGIQGSLGPRTMAADDDYLWSGGEFTTVNGSAQQGLTRFGFHAVTGQSAKPRTPAQVGANASMPGRVVVHVRGTDDYDNARLQYVLIKDGDAANPIPVGVADSKPWSYPELTYVDTDVSPGTFHSYEARAIDPHGVRSNRSTPATVLVASEASTYAETVLDTAPSIFWRLNETTGTFAANATWGVSGTYSSGVRLGRPGVPDIVPADFAANFNGTSTGVLRADQPLLAPRTYSLEGWFSTSTSTGGKLVGLTGTNTWGFSSNADRLLYMNNSGQLVFGAVDTTVTGNTRVTVKTPGRYNDGTWHHVIATMAHDGMKIYMDGNLAVSSPSTPYMRYEGTWVVGGDSLSGWPEAPRSSNFNGLIDDVSIYPFALTAEEALYHHEIVLNPGLFSS